MKQSARSAKAVKIESITVDGQNLIIKTTEPNGSLLASLTEPAFVIMDTADLKDVASNQFLPVLTKSLLSKKVKLLNSLPLQITGVANQVLIP